MTAESSRELDRNAVIPVFEPFRRVNAALLELLEDLSPEDWARPTVHPQRDVKDLAAHLAHGSLRRVTGLRDGYHRPGPPLRSKEELVDFIQRDNTEFMVGMHRLSPRIVIELVERYDPEMLRLFEAADLHAEGLGVAWAGETTSAWWFDIAREYTEKWHHQQQIRDATGRPLLYDRALLVPVLETFARGLPYAFRAYAGSDGAPIAIRATGEADCGWTLVREADRWSLWSGTSAEASTRLSLSADTAWRVWTKSLDPAEARTRVEVEGDPAALEPLVSFVAIMA